MTHRKLIEVALPLDPIDAKAAGEKPSATTATDEK